jgi:predicted amidohydrolase YtcJ
MPPPDLILHGGKIITLDRSSRLAQAVSVRSGHVVAVGDAAALLKDAAPTTRRIDLAGRSVLPGFFDAHPHADREGLKARGGIPIAGLHSVATIVDVVKHAAQTTPAGEWIVLMPMGEPPHEYMEPTAAFQIGMISMPSLPTTPSTSVRCGAGGVAVHFRRLPTRWRSGARA